MAGEWIKVEIGLPEKPEVMQLARILGVTRHHVVGSVVRFWVWADKNTVDGVVDGVESSDVDDVVALPGFCDAMESVGWLHVDAKEHSISIPKFDRHNGESAKKRALKNERQARWRRNAAASTPPSTGASTREEKRRDKTPLPPSGAFLRFWSAWPPNERKEAKGKCWELWLKKDLDLISEQILSHVDSLKSSDRWRGGYIPAPLVYLNQRRWEGADEPTVQKVDL